MLNWPVLAVPAGYNFQVLETLVLPTDYTRHFVKYELLPVTELATLWKAEIQILHVAMEFMLNDEQTTIRKILEKRLKNYKYTFHNIALEANVAQTVTKCLSESRAAILVMIGYEHTLWEKISREPIVKKIAFHTKPPLLVLPGH